MLKIEAKHRLFQPISMTFTSAVMADVDFTKAPIEPVFSYPATFGRPTDNFHAVLPLQHCHHPMSRNSTKTLQHNRDRTEALEKTYGPVMFNDPSVTFRSFHYTIADIIGKHANHNEIEISLYFFSVKGLLKAILRDVGGEWRDKP